MKKPKRSLLSVRGLVWLLILAVATLHSTATPAQANPDVPYFLWLPLVMRPDAITNPIHNGVATYYDATGDGSCMFGVSPSDLMVAAMDRPDYGNADYCGGYVHVVGPKGEVTLRIVDLCPGCAAGHLDLSQEAFAKIADLPQGRVSIQWQVVSPAISGPIAYQFKSGSSKYWTAVQVRNHRNPVAKFEYRMGGSAWTEVARTSYNYFVQASGMGPGPYDFRVTDIYGNVLTDSGISLTVGGTVNGIGQFPYGP